MPFDETLASRVRRVLDGRTDVEEKKMFGGLAFMVRGHMSVGVVKRMLMVRVDADEHATLLKEPHARPMDFTGRPMTGFLYVDPEGVASAGGLRKWIGRGVAFAESKPRKTRTLKTRAARLRDRAR